MPQKREILQKFQQLRKHLLNIGRALQVLVLNSCQLHNSLLKPSPWIHKGLKGVCYAALHHLHSADFYNFITLGV